MKVGQTNIDENVFLYSTQISDSQEIVGAKAIMFNREITAWCYAF